MVVVAANRSGAANGGHTLEARFAGVSASIRRRPVTDFRDGLAREGSKQEEKVPELPRGGTRPTGTGLWDRSSDPAFAARVPALD